MPTQKVGKRPATSRSGAGSEHHSELCQGEGHRGLDLRVAQRSGGETPGRRTTQGHRTLWQRNQACPLRRVLSGAGEERRPASTPLQFLPRRRVGDQRVVSCHGRTRRCGFPRARLSANGWGRAGGAVFFVETQTDVRFLTAVCGIGTAACLL